MVKFLQLFHNIYDRTLEVPTSRIVIIEGIYALSERLRPLLDLRVSVTGGVHFDLVKRVLRDIQRAGQEPEEIIHQISETVCFRLPPHPLFSFESLYLRIKTFLEVFKYTFINRYIQCTRPLLSQIYKQHILKSSTNSILLLDFRVLLIY